MQYVICSIGLTANGKTTILRKISKVCGIPFISEGSIKRSFVKENYTFENSLDDGLRNRGYREAITRAFNALQTNLAVIIDASFHQSFRRKWIYDEIAKRRIKESDIVVVWIYCVCEDEKTIANRIRQRYLEPVKTADNQANSIEVYNFTKSEFDSVNISDFHGLCTTYVITYSSYHSKVIDQKCNANVPAFINLEISNWRTLWESYM